MKKLLFLLVFIPLVSFGQDYGNSADAIKLCTVLQTNNFGTDAEAEKGLDRILSVIGASKRFVLQPCSNINNAVAASYKGIRYIFYDRNFMSSVNSGNNWENLFILAHEVGHHINGHSLDLVLYATEAVEPETLFNQRKQELEADEFAGFILAKLGATLEQTSSTINLIASNSDDTYSTHPSKSKRLAAINKGYNKGINKTFEYQPNTEMQIYEEYLSIAMKKFHSKDYYSAIEYFTKYNSKYVNYMSHMMVGLSKANLNDFNGAIVDYDKSIEILPYVTKNDSRPYENRANAKIELKDYYGAIADFTKVIELSPNDSGAYRNRGSAKFFLRNVSGACTDWRKAITLGEASARKLLNKYCN